MAPAVPRKLGSYRIEDVIARHGGGGAVYRARHETTGQLVALKHLPAPPEGTLNTERLKREMQLAKHLQHTNVVRVLDAVQLENGDRLIAMELIDGYDLAERAAGGRILPTRAVMMIEQIGAALLYAHREGVVHRDVKPGNAMIAHDGRVVLLDFGLARHLEDSTITASDQQPGTFAYMSPEQIQGRRATVKSDVYALTGLLFTLLTGRVPYPYEARAALIHAHLALPPPRPSELRADLAPFDDVIAKGMAKSWDKRLSLDKLIAAAKRAGNQWARAELPATSGSATPLRRPSPGSDDLTWPFPSAGTSVVTTPRRKPADVLVATVVEHRLSATMAAIFFLTIALVLILRSLTA
jgi:serine/threonine-protein kinase